MKRGKIVALGLAVMMMGALATGCGAAKKPSSFRILDETLGEEQYGIAFRKGDVALGLEVQSKLDAMIQEGKAAEISQKWFGEDILLKDQAFLKETTAKAGDKSLEKVQTKGTLVLGLDDSFPPMGFRDESDQIVGFDIDLATEVAKRMGVELKLQPIDWDSKELELSTGRIDCIWNGMSISEERLQNMYFTKPYVSNHQIVVVPQNSDIKVIADLKDKVIGLQKGSSSLDALNSNAIASQVKQVVELGDKVTVFYELKAGRVDAFVVDVVVGRYILANDK